MEAATAAMLEPAISGRTAWARAAAWRVLSAWPWNSGMTWRAKSSKLRALRSGGAQSWASWR